MGIRTLCLYLLGQRQAILDIAANRQAIWVGLLFVFSAGFAREYDGEDLLHEPWHAVIPLAASLVSSFVLFTLTWGVAKLKRAPGPGFFAGYRAFLGLFWLTAPLAWLYAIPYERLLTPYEATAVNLWTLGIVSVWRVFLMIRVVAVLMGYGWPSLFLVMTFADALALAALQFVPVPILSIMGGVRLSPSEEMIALTALGVSIVGTYSLPVWAIGAIVVWIWSKPAWNAPDPTTNISRPLWSLAIVSVAVWAFILPFTQPDQLLRRQAERALDEGRVTDALHLMSEHSREDFPRHWTPLPRRARPDNQDRPKLVDVLEVLASEASADWVQAVFLQRLDDEFHFSQMDKTDLKRIAELLSKLPNGKFLIDQWLEQENDYNWPFQRNLHILKGHLE